ncbi:hypothetical protein HZC09_04490 [Candidatus Micrarchaeota archaeon]|nr:hypothetical protein [Candidatus Micrarchaeota archaeon]
MNYASALIVLALGIQLTSLLQPSLQSKLVSDLGWGNENAPMLVYGEIRGVGQKSFLLCLNARCLRVLSKVPKSFEGRRVWVEGTKRGDAFFTSEDSIDVSR